jgi:dihydrofolate synthase/folylpolyglutamate synthase
MRDSETGCLPFGPLSGVLVRNAACALLAWASADGGRLPDRQIIGEALARMTLPGRLQRLPGAWLVDLAHNEEGAGALATELASESSRGRTLAVFGILVDKDVEAVVTAVRPFIDRWFVADLDSNRAETAERLRERLEKLGCDSVCTHASVRNACASARAEAASGDRIVAFGSFHVVGPTLEFLGVYSPASHAGGVGATPR